MGDPTFITTSTPITRLIIGMSFWKTNTGMKILVEIPIIHSSRSSAEEVSKIRDELPMTEPDLRINHALLVLDGTPSSELSNAIASTVSVEAVVVRRESDPWKLINSIERLLFDRERIMPAQIREMARTEE